MSAIRDSSLIHLDLCANLISNVGCERIGTLLKDPNSKLQMLDPGNINNEGAAIIANNLANNTKLQKLYLDNPVVNEIDPSLVEDIYIELICNTSSVNGMHNSNHTLEILDLGRVNQVHRVSHLQLNSLLELKEGNKQKTCCNQKDIGKPP